MTASPIQDYDTCDLHKTFQSKNQTGAGYITLKGKAVKQALQDMHNNIPFDLFLKKYPEADVSQIAVSDQKKRNHENLKSALAELPEYISARFELEEPE